MLCFNCFTYLLFIVYGLYVNFTKFLLKFAMKSLVKFSSRIDYVQVISFVGKTDNQLSCFVVIFLKIMHKHFVY